MAPEEMVTLDPLVLRANQEVRVPLALPATLDVDRKETLDYPETEEEMELRATLEIQETPDFKEV